MTPAAVKQVKRTLVISNSDAELLQQFHARLTLLEDLWAQAEEQKFKTRARMHEIPAVQTSPDCDRTACRGIPPVRSQVGSGAQIAEHSKSRGIIIKAALVWTLMAAPVLLPQHVRGLHLGLQGVNTPMIHDEMNLQIVPVPDLEDCLVRLLRAHDTNIKLMFVPGIIRETLQVYELFRFCHRSRNVPRRSVEVPFQQPLNQ